MSTELRVVSLSIWCLIACSVIVCLAPAPIEAFRGCMCICIGAFVGWRMATNDG